jgi:hypothetical protein
MIVFHTPSGVSYGRTLGPITLVMFISQFSRLTSKRQNVFYLAGMLGSIQQLPISERKIVITACQLQDVDDQLLRNTSLITIDYHTRNVVD